MAKGRPRALIQTEDRSGQGLMEYSRTKRFSSGKCCRIQVTRWCCIDLLSWQRLSDKWI
jgi:hypothetical protein